MENSIHFFKNSTPRKILPPPKDSLGGAKNFLGGAFAPPKTPKRRPWVVSGNMRHFCMIACDKLTRRDDSTPVEMNRRNP